MIIFLFLNKLEIINLTSMNKINSFLTNFFKNLYVLENNKKFDCMPFTQKENL